MTDAPRDHTKPPSGIEPILADLVELFLQRLQAGESLDPSGFAAQHPEHAEPLRQLLPALEMMADLGRSAARDRTGLPPSEDISGPGLGVLGDFHILREVGRGGMGVVYEAEQLSLRRRVALKVLPFAAALDPRHLQRFKAEAQAAALLHHTNIAPVHAVGSERGVHYYAMQFIEGRTLADVIRELRRLEGKEQAESEAREERPGRGSPGTRRVAAYGPERAGRGSPEPAAGEHGSPDPAPIEGSVSGDIGSVRLTTDHWPLTTATDPALGSTSGLPAPDAPSRPTERVTASPSNSSTRNRAYFLNVARLGVEAAEALEHAHQEGIIHRDIKPANLMVDAKGNLWVTDFGLARLQGDSGLTVSGDLIGTLRYMSPEQALGKRVLIDGRTDIYSLGVTLYELVTLQPAFEARDRQELLRRIVEEEPQSPRKLDSSMPRELETIILKAMAKEPGGRYQTARNLADDLMRFLEHKPILARRPTYRERVIKWARRHPSVPAAALVSLVVLVVSLSASTVLIQRQRDEARRQEKRAELRSSQARRAVDTMYTRFAQKWLANQPGLKPAQCEFLMEALRFYQEFSREEAQDDATLRLVGAAFLRVAQIQRNLGDLSAAEAAGRSAREIFTSLTHGTSARLEDHRLLAEAEVAEGELAYVMGRIEAERGAYLRAIEIRRSLVRERPDDLADRLALATALYRLHDVPANEESVAILRDLLEGEPRRADYRFELSNALAYLGSLFYDRGNVVESERTHREALSLRRQLSREFADDYLYRRRLLNSLSDLGRDFVRSARFDEAQSTYQEALATSRTLSEDFPSFPINRSNVAACLNDLASVARIRGQFGKSERDFVEAIAIAEGVSAEHPDMPGLLTLLAEIRSEYGHLLEDTGRYAEAIRAYRESLDVLERLAPRTINVLQNQDQRAKTSARLAHLLATSTDANLRDTPAAVLLARKAAALGPTDDEVWGLLGIACYRAGNWDAAIEILEPSMERHSAEDARALLVLSMAHQRRGEADAARSWMERANCWMGKDRPTDVITIRLRDEASALLRTANPTAPTARNKEDDTRRSPKR